MAEDTPKRLQITRRTAIKWGAIGLGAVALGRGALLVNERSTRGGFETPENDLMMLGKEEPIQLSKYGINWTPDGHIPYITFPDGRREYYVSGNAASFAMLEDKGSLFIPRERNQQGQAIPVVGPDRGGEYRNGYTAITSILQLNKENPNHLFGITHNEQWANRDGSLDYRNFTSTIGILESVDGGKNWLDKGVALKAADALQPGKNVTGVGQPCAIIKEEGDKRFVYVYYIYWPSHEGREYQIHLSRTEVKGDNVGAFEHYTKNGFQKGVEVSPTTVSPVIPIPADIAESGYAALPSVSYNTYLGKYLAVFETHVGFCVTTSNDGLTWDEAKLILKFPQGQYPHKRGQLWASNPSLWSLNKPTDQITDRTGVLVYSRGIWDNPHSMVRVPFELK